MDNATILKRIVQAHPHADEAFLLRLFLDQVIANDANLQRVLAETRVLVRELMRQSRKRQRRSTH